MELVNQTAESSPGFIWRLTDESGDATIFQAFSDPSIIVNMPTWQSIDSLKNFMFRTYHRDFLRRKQEWFNTMAKDNDVLC